MSNQNTKPATLKTIADMTGLSLSTVSLSLRGGEKLKQETRDKVAKAAAELGYVPNRAGVRLRTGQTNVLSIVLPRARNTMDYAPLLIQGISASLMGGKYHLNITPELEQDDPTRAVRYILQNKTADGVILTHTFPDDPRVKLLNEAGLPFVTHGRTELFTPHAYYDFNAEAFVAEAARRLLDTGRSRFLLLADDNGTTNYANTIRGYQRALSDLQISGDSITDSEELTSPDRTRALGLRLAAQVPFYDAIICNNELTALAVMGGLTAGGKRLGSDYGLICKQTTQILPTVYPEIDSISEDLFETGFELARILIERLGGIPADQLQHLQIPAPQWRSG